MDANRKAQANALVNQAIEHAIQRGEIGIQVAAYYKGELVVDAWGGVADLIPEPPSTYYYRQVYGCFFRDQHGLNSLDVIGVDNVTFETDYPHSDSTWPHSKDTAIKLMGNLPDDIVYKLVRGNAIEMLGLDFDRA